MLAVAWAGYLIPKALKHHDEVARTRSIDRFSTAMRVLARREPVNRRQARLVVTPARAKDNPRVLPPSRVAAPAQVAAASPVSASPGPAGRPAVRRAAARAAARRRRRILIFLVLCDLVVGVLAGLAILQMWAPAIPVAVTLLFLVLCRTQVRRENERAWTRALADVAHVAEELAGADDEGLLPRRAVRVDTPHGTPAEVVAEVINTRNEQGFEEVSPQEETLSIPAVVYDAVSVPTDDGGSLWDPLPMTLPTYVSKPMAKRTVRTIDLSEPGTWTSGHTEADTQLVQDAEATPRRPPTSAPPPPPATEPALGVELVGADPARRPAPDLDSDAT